jgi:hypothetical protein
VATSLGGVSVLGQVGSEVDVATAAKPLFPLAASSSPAEREREEKFPLDGAITRSKEERTKEGNKGPGEEGGRGREREREKEGGGCIYNFVEVRRRRRRRQQRAYLPT